MKNRLSAYAAPAAAILGGLILLLSPDTATALIATVIGWGALILGILLMIVGIASKQGLGLLWKALISLAVGLWLTRSPMSLAMVFGKVLGIGLLLGAISGWRKSVSSAGRSIYLAEGAIALVLLIAPLTASRVVYTVVGLILVAAGLVMLGNRQKKGPNGGNIIDV